LPLGRLAARQKKKEARVLGTIPSCRFGRPDEFGATCAFLCSAHAGYLTGT
jgi:3-oxoacyl-[acyl-carrier protein] reductase